MTTLYKLMSAILFITFINTSAYEYLYIRDPRGWNGGAGTIEEARFTVKPKGAFAEVSLYMTFSARGLGFVHNDSLEIEFYFEMERNTVFTDLWLWVGNDIMKAFIMDRWTATNIYENIVKRRKDPALLVKEGEGRYRLRIFPLAGDEQRKVKMTFLVPATLMNGLTYINLPLNLLSTTRYPLINLPIITYPNQMWTNPSIPGFPNQFRQGIDSEIGEYLYTDIHRGQNIPSLKIAFEPQTDSTLHLSVYKGKSVNYYQLMIPPGEFLNEKPHKKIVFVVEYVEGKSNVVPAQVLSALKQTIEQYFTESDSFNIIFSNITPKKVSNTWLSANKQRLETLFYDLPSWIVSYTNLKSSLTEAADFISANGNDGRIFLIANSDQYGNFNNSRELINKLKEKMKPVKPVYICDYQTQNFLYNYIDNRYYYGNEYLYTNLARITKGEHARSWYDQLPNLLAQIAATLNGFITNFDVATTLQDGFTYGKFTNFNLNQPINLTAPIVQFGRYSGTFSGTIQISGTYNFDLFTKKIEFDNISETDSTLEQFWTGKQIDLLEHEPYSNDLADEIVKYSISKRVLSLYSAFLALEPNDTIKVCTSCIDESTLPTEVKEQPVSYGDTLKIQAYPNPFNSQTRIVVELPGSFSADELLLKIYDIVGQEVKSFDPSEFAGKSRIELIWNGKNDNGENAASGIYLMVVHTPKATKSIKLLNFK